MERKHCSIVGCGHEAEEYGLCTAHFTSALVHGMLHYSAHNHAAH